MHRICSRERERMVEWKELNVVQYFNKFTFYSMFVYLIAPNFANNNVQHHKRIKRRIRWNLILFCFAHVLFRFFHLIEPEMFSLSLHYHCSLFIALLGVFSIEAIDITFSMSCSHPSHFLATDFVFIICCCLLSLHYAALHSKLLFHYFHQ